MDSYPADSNRVSIKADAHRYQLRLKAFDTLVSVDIPIDAVDARCAQDVLANVAASCEMMERELSRFLPTSDVSRINAAAGNPVTISDDTAELLQAAIGYSEASGGLFDITMAPVCDCWDFHRGVVPEEHRVAQALAHVDYRNVQVDAGGPAKRAQAVLTDAQAAIDLGGIAKGFIADRLVAFLQGEGVTSAFINLGGNVSVMGNRSQGQPWKVGIADPRNPRTPLLSLPATDLSVVTSGAYERSFTSDGVTYGHILSPRTGRPVQTDVAGATVLSRRSIDGDGYSTTLFMLGMRDALDFTEAHPEIECILVDAANNITVSSGLHVNA